MSGNSAHKTDLANAREALLLLSWMPGFPSGDLAVPQVGVIAAAVASFADDRPQQHEDLGTVTPLSWLVIEIAKTCTFFPKPIEMRRIYEQSFGPLDGKEAAELTSVIEDQ